MADTNIYQINAMLRGLYNMIKEFGIKRVANKLNELFTDGTEIKSLIQIKNKIDNIIAKYYEVNYICQHKQQRLTGRALEANIMYIILLTNYTDLTQHEIAFIIKESTPSINKKLKSYANYLQGKENEKYDSVYTPFFNLVLKKAKIEIDEFLSK